ncbi:glycosyltransferase family 4 protein [Actinoplanes sp. KI2]|uniref:glycosyltransferase family 4 protein n=1 Tax=Actinoplanes sp. KI2 TaxID=2983315 RepID=UPI0021D59FD7|nr:glycosyltransferase family 1 protein [Actinoplanes sp. KI2]MCU7730404.1 glycosyltransferase family 4 protein [Actinoplanes sp. KI2]
MTPLRVFVEGTPLFRQRTGVGQYTKYLLEALFRLDEENQYTIYAFGFLGRGTDTRPIPETSRVGYRFIRYMHLKAYNAVVRKLTAPPIDIMVGSRPDLFIFPDFVRHPLPLGSPAITVIYDLSFVLHPEHVAARNRRYLTRYVPQTIEKSQHIVTISENSKREIVEYYGTDPAKISIVSPAIDHSVFYPRPASEIGAVAGKYHIAKPYILYTGTLEPRKNIRSILDAYAKLPEHVRASYSLVLAGGKGWLDESIQNRLDELQHLDIITTGYVPDEDLPALYSGASVFVYPSLYEGYGMPPLEAMACDTPVIVANNSSLPEVVGDAGLLVDAHDVDSLAQHMEKVLGDPALADELRRRGLVRAKASNWEESARRLLAVISEVGARR